MLRVGYDLQFAVRYAGPIDLAGQIQFISPWDDSVVATRELFLSNRTTSLVMTMGRCSWNYGYLEELEAERLYLIPVRFVPVREVALKMPGVEVYYGGTIERYVPVIYD